VLGDLGGRGSQVQNKSDLFTSTGVGGDLGDELTLYQLHFYRLPREEAVVSQLRGASVVIFPRGHEGDSKWRAMLHNFHSFGGREGGRDTDYTRST